jgi:hypothetical protein
VKNLLDHSSKRRRVIDQDLTVWATQTEPMKDRSLLLRAPGTAALLNHFQFGFHRLDLTVRRP